MTADCVIPLPPTVRGQANLPFPGKLHFLFERHRYKVAHSGRGAAKSWSFARTLLMQGREAKRWGWDRDAVDLRE